MISSFNLRALATSSHLLLSLLALLLLKDDLDLDVACHELPSDIHEAKNRGEQLGREERGSRGKKLGFLLGNQLGGILKIKGLVRDV